MRPARDVVVYVNSSHDDELYIRESARSAESFRGYLPDAKFVLVTDFPRRMDEFDECITGRFEVPSSLQQTDHKNGQMVAKLSTLPTIEGDRIMYLGSDTYALSDAAGGIFDILERFDIAAAHAPKRVNRWKGQSDIPDVPTVFPEFNCDVVLWRRTESTIRFLENWRDLYLKHAFAHPHDQGVFRWLAWNTDLRVAVLPPEFNYRGALVRNDTAILQNRDALDIYTGERPGTRLPPIARATNRVFRRLSLGLAIMPVAPHGRG